MNILRANAVIALLIVLSACLYAGEKDTDGSGLVEWPACRSESDINLEFPDKVCTNAHLYKKECDFISNLSCKHSGKTE